MTRTQLLAAREAEASLQCEDCRTLVHADEPYCGACGGRLGPRKKSKIAYSAVAAFLFMGAVILYWIAYN